MKQSGNKNVRIPVIAVLALAVLVLLVFIYARSTEPKYVTSSQIRVQPGNISPLRDSGEFASALTAMHAGGYADMIARLEEDIQKNPADASLSPSFLLLGWTQLQLAVTEKYDMFFSLDTARIKLATHYLGLALKRNSARQNSLITSNACYFLGIAYLLLEDKPTAEQYLNIVILQKGDKYRLAREILSRPAKYE